MLFPLYFDLSDQNILVVGGGTIATRRVRSLMGFAGKIRVISPEISDEIAEFVSGEGQPQTKEADYNVEMVDACHTVIEHVGRTFLPDDLIGAGLVLAATNNSELNAEIYDMCKKMQIPVNICSDQTKCDFQFPSVIEADGLVIGINGSGKNHRKVKEMRQKLEELLSVDGHTPVKSKYIR